MELFFKIFFGFLCAILLVCLVVVFHNGLYKYKCREQGGVPVSNVCIKAETIKVVY